MFSSLIALVATASAHPGHGEPGSSHTVAHYLVEPVHIGLAALVLLVGAAAFVVRRRLSA